MATFGQKSVYRALPQVAPGLFYYTCDLFALLTERVASLSAKLHHERL